MRVVAFDDEHRHGGEERLPRRVAGDEQRDPHAQQRLAREETKAREQAARLVLDGQRPPLWDEDLHEHERDDVRRGVDEEHARRAEDADQHAGDRRPEQHRRANGALEERVRLRDDALVFAEQLGDDQPLRGEVRGAEGTERERHRKQHDEGEVTAPVEHGHEEHQRSANRVGGKHRSTSAEPLQECS